MTWTRIATLIVSIAATVTAGTGVVVLSVNGIHSQVVALQAQAAADRAEAAADRRAWQASMDAFRTSRTQTAKRSGRKPKPTGKPSVEKCAGSVNDKRGLKAR